MSKDKDGASLERDGKYDEFIMEELKRLNAKVAEQNTELDQRIQALEKLEIEKNFDLKLDKEEFANFVSLLTEETINPMQKEIDKCKKDIQCIESFLENLSQTIKALEMTYQNNMNDMNNQNDP